MALTLPALVAFSTVSGFGVAVLLLALPFVFVVLIRLAALAHALSPPQRHPQAPVLTDALLPTYSVFVPLHRERDVAPALIAALAAIDYPARKLEIFFITEADDHATRDALVAAAPPPHMQILTIPQGSPKTKPRALNYALRFARGELAAVFDAEDIPDPMQLRRAAAMFATASGKLACVQARLSIYNPRDTFLTRQFALEYAVLFETILPALQRFGLPILLGGTSNHFRRSALNKVGAWDAYNVTEDADLGVRLARYGYRVAVLDGETHEEAPATWRVWRGQRTRWLKGWMQQTGLLSFFASH